jgi:hypothetical protein
MSPSYGHPQAAPLKNAGRAASWLQESCPPQVPTKPQRTAASSSPGSRVVIIFRGAYEQNGNTIAPWTDVGVDRHVAGGWSIPLTWFQSLNPLVIFIGTPILVG